MVCWIHYTTTITPQLKFKEVVLSQPSIMWYKPANQKIWIFTVYESWIIKQTKEKRVHIRREWMKLLVSQESVMLCPWRTQTQKYGIKWVDWGLNYHVTMKWLQLRPAALSSVNLLWKWSIYFYRGTVDFACTVYVWDYKGATPLAEKNLMWRHKFFHQWYG